MNPELIADTFNKWRAQGTFESLYTIDADTYQEKWNGLFKMSTPVVSKPVEYTCNGDDVFVISDLHIASGRDKAGVYKGSENFFADEAFDRFIAHLLSLKQSKPALLIINGDMFDFLRTTEYPGKEKKLSATRKIVNFLKQHKSVKPDAPAPSEIDNEFSTWSTELKKVGIPMDEQQLRRNISKRERQYGLETNDYKTIYKLMLIKRGHPLFFTALAKWLLAGNKLLVLKGNHDVEIYWDKVQDYIRLMLAESILSLSTDADLKSILEWYAFPAIKFIDDSVIIDKTFYVEHGHRYDKFTMVLDGAVLPKNPDQVNIPFGSFFNRYVINRVELYYPYLDKVRPTGNILPMLIRDNFPLALKVIFQQLPFAARMLSTRPRYLWFMFNRVIWFVLALLIPIVILLVFDGKPFFSFFFQKKPDPDTRFVHAVTSAATALVMMVLAYVTTRLVGWFQLSEPDSLAAFAKQRSADQSFTVMTMGHTHNPGSYIFRRETHFYNTGTWIPVIETSDASVRSGYSCTFLHLQRDLSGNLAVVDLGRLQRWNDDAGRTEPQLLIARK